MALPQYEAPPVVEVALSLQFGPLESLRTAHFGILWGRLRSKGFSQIEDHGELEPSTEIFDKPTSNFGLRIRTFDDAPPLARVWFLNEGANELVQVQRDRLIVNWRKGAGAAPYPHYAQILTRFKDAMSTFSEFAEVEKLGKIIPTQCEITYINQVPADAVGSTHGEASQLMTMWSDQYSDDYLKKPEDVTFVARYRMQNSDRPKGRLIITFQPGFQTIDGTKIFIISVTARGGPMQPTMESVYDLFDEEHEWIVRGFTSTTTPKFHELWRRTNG